MEPTHVVAARQQWEYCDVYGNVQSFVKKLNEEGKQGWEVVNVFSETTVYRAILKRPIPN